MKFLLVDDHALLRHGLRLLLDRLSGGHVFLEAGNCAEAFAAASVHWGHRSHLAGFGLPDLNGLDGLVRLREICPTTPVVLMSANENLHIILDGLRPEPRALSRNPSSLDVMARALQVVLAGGVYIADGRGGRPCRTVAREPHAHPRGNARYWRCLVKDMSNKEIARPWTCASIRCGCMWRPSQDPRCRKTGTTRHALR